MPTKLSKGQRELLEAYAEGVRRGGRAGGGLREKLGLVVTAGRTRRRGGAGAWLELAVEADVEAVEAVSEILGRVAPGGTTVEPAFDLVDEGLGARVDPSRPAIVRGYVPARDRGGRGPGRRRGRPRRSGHLQAFGLRPIGDAADPDRPRGRLGRRPGRRTSRSCASAGASSSGPPGGATAARPDDVVLALDPGMAFGTGLHPTTRLCLAALEALADRGRLGGARVLDVGCGSGILAIAAVRLGARTALGVDTDPIADRGDGGQRPAQRHGPPDPCPRRAACPTGEQPFDVVLANLIAGRPRAAGAGLCATSSGPAGRSSRRASSSTARPEVRAAFEAAGLVVDGRTAEGEWVALEAHRPA